MINILMPDLTGNERKYLNECIDESWVSSQGKFVSMFEEMVLRGANDGYCLSTSNGTVALHLALAALGVGKGDEVIVPELTFGATLNAISYVGAVPVIVDVDPSDWNMSKENLSSAFSEKTKALMPVALFGNPSGIADIVNWADEHDLLCIVDAAEAVGATIGGIDIGAFGDAVTYSYFGNKTITTGEGGAVVFRDETVAKRARVLRDHGMSPGRRYHHEEVGFNYRMTNMQAALGVAQYERLDEILSRRQEIINGYVKRLSGLSLTFQGINENCSSSNWVFTVLIPKEKMMSVMTAFKGHDIEYRRCFEPMSWQPAFRLARVSGDLTIAENIYDTLLMLPTHAKLSDDDIDFVCRALKAAL